MSADHLEFLKSKFMEDLRDAEEEHTGENEIPLHSHFLQIRDVLQEKRFTPSTPIGTKGCLYNAIGALEECVILSEKREPRKKDDPLHGYTLAELWLLRKTKKLLLKIKKRLVSTRENDAVESSLASTSDSAVASSSSTSLPAFIPNPEGSDGHFDRDEIEGFDEQEVEISDELVDGKKWGKGFKKIGIVGIGGSGKTALAKLVFTNPEVVDFFYYRIWICLSQKLTARDGDVNLKEMVREMLKQCADEDEEESKDKYDRLQDVDEDALLENLKSVLMGGNKSYLIVFDGIWDIKMDWYLKLGDKLEWFDNHKLKAKERESESSAGVIITTRLHHIPKQMRMHLHHMAPPIPENVLFYQKFDEDSFLHQVFQRMKDEFIQQCDGLPLAAEILPEIIRKQMLGER
ncbi:hypothetical protein PVL29_003739 [Vitis rotundifolia]|uniref:NB-ARC domain-containing protein n=1 Tax=Vitis rotundifolia TaxID=103349 RepID=A0AA39ADT9_VITRO|nr:hypothetical protein PVL29_003739 [Vitis rotundifolia]